ncbi:transglycosylase SLT domain-containing protein [Microvirga terrae]|uniref:Transglycosylase SLT domain-containing protein n=1 Tax=Microvirga terrae TaxID=2740529 RepID=A0ABY5RYN7_9HYPH|nr:transglycosylase SLT domain-containing protein [Microvirga terrae]UVF21364.1 transglycosylase SLT domain-containing protein [Microvirga terrae]
MTIKIPVSADFNGDDLNKQIGQINARIKLMGDAIAKANGTKFEPITLKTKEDLKYFVQQSEKLLKIQGELRNRMQRSGQGSENPVMANWSKMYLNEASRLKRQQEMLVFFGSAFESQSRPPATPRRPNLPAPTTPPANSNQPAGGNSQWWQQTGRILQSGLGQMGPVGGVASRSVGSGMAGGFGAGFMGLLGGLAALGIGKALSAATENLDKARDNLVDLDALKRTLGDVNVSFEGLKRVVEANASSLGITYSEAIKLSSQFSRLGNVSGDQYKELNGELLNGVGFSRGFGLDPATGMSFFGQMRGMRMTGSEQDSRRMGLLIGETIAKSDAFAKSDEVMEAIAGYVTSQNRNSLTRANIAGYAGTFSALAGSGIPGLDVAGTSAMMGRINSSLMAGGAKGEASQFFTSRVANRMGLSPIQMAILREGGAFATNSQMFGEGSIYARYMGKAGPGGSTTFLQGTLGELRKAYRDPGMLAMATANHLGIGMGQAMSLLSIAPNSMGALERGLAGSGVDISNLTGSGIASLAKVYGSDADRRSVADSLFRRTGDDALSAADSERLRNVMGSGSSEDQKKILTELVASREQERTMGSDVRDARAALDNIKTSIADRLVPLTQEMRHGIMYLAGEGGKVSPQEITRRVIESEYRGKAEAISGRYSPLIAEQTQRYNAAKARSLGVPTAEEAQLPREEQLRAMNERQKAAQAEMDAASAEIKRLQKQRDDELAVNSVRAQSAMNPNGINTEILAQIESGGRHRDANGNLITSSAGAQGVMQVMPATLRNPGFGIAPAKDDSEAENRRVGNALAQALYNKYGGDVDKAVAAYNWGSGNMDKVIGKYGADWRSHIPAETRGHIDKYNRQAAQLPMTDPGVSGVNVSVSAQPIEVIHRNERGQQVAPTQTLQTKVTPARPFGTQ